MRNYDYLFNQYSLSQILDLEKQKMFEEIDAMNPERILTADTEDLAKILVEKYSINPPKLLEDKITATQSETQVDVSQDQNRFISNRHRPTYISGTKITYFIPFEGDGNLFYAQSSSISFNPPRATILGQEIHVTYTITNHDSSSIKNQFENCVGQIKQLLTGTYNDVKIFNSQLHQESINKINLRRDKLLKDQKMADDLGYPLRK